MYCVRCGKKLPDDCNKCRKCPDSTRAGAYYCPHCGNGVKGSQKVCDVCGGELDFSPEHYVLPPSTPPKSRVKAAVLAFVLGFTGLHFQYLVFPKKFRKRLLWAMLSLVFSLLCLIAFQTGMERAFPGGTYDAEIAASMAGYAITTAAGIVGGLVSFVLSWVMGIANGVSILRKPKYQDGNGNYLE